MSLFFLTLRNLNQYSRKIYQKLSVYMAVHSVGFSQNSQLYQDLIDRLRKRNVIKSTTVEETMLAVDRFYYSKNYPYADSPQSIGYGATISAPHIHAYALELLKDKLISGETALDVGCGSGFLTACMAIMMGERGKVIGVEHVPQLAELSKENILNGNPELLESERVVIVKGDGRLGVPEYAPYNAIHVGAAASDIPSALIDQLKVGGRIVIPLDSKNEEQELVQVDKVEEGKLIRKRVLPVRFVPLTSKSNQWPL